MGRGFWWKVAGGTVFLCASLLGRPRLLGWDLLSGSPALRSSAELRLWAAIACQIVGLGCFLIGVAKRAADPGMHD